MPQKFDGSLEELGALLGEGGIEGGWEELGPTKWRFRSKACGVLNWWPSTGTVQTQGQPAARSAIESALAGGAKQLAQANEEAPAETPQIFIVHGHDTDGRDQLELALRRLGVEPFVLMNATGGGLTIIEALEGKIGRDFSSDFGIVLMTPDDLGYSKTDGADAAEPRARQNVVLETGMLLSSLTRQRMALVVKGHIELPSDLEGIIRYGYNDHVREIVGKLAQRLREVGFEIGASQITAAMQ